ncbi:MAG: fibronectin type III domain-containing protein, partial [Thermoguttaceae bacterium]|nr:fibronectin type III domain-containing protein [Thermoguttaceae bacterium]
MQFDSIRSLFANAVARSARAHNGARVRTGAGNNPPRARVLSLESLESRELLSATPLETASVSEIALASQETAPLAALDLSGVQTASEPASTVVTSLADVVDATDGVVTLREAITVYANNWDTITFAPSLKGGTITLNGSEITINKSLTIDASALWNIANDAPGLTIDANSLSQIFHITGDNYVWLDSLAFTGGNATEGGAISTDDGTLTVSNSTFFNNHSHWDGGAIYSWGSTLSIYDSDFHNNTSSSDYSGRGGAISAYSSTLSIYYSSFQNNTAYSGYNGEGGAIRAYNSGLTISNSSFTQNEAGYGSAIWCYCRNDAFLWNVTVSDNISNMMESDNYRDPGAIVFSGLALNIYNSIVAGNVNGDLGVYSDYWQENDNAVNAYNVLSDFSEWSNADAVAYGYDRSRPLFTNPEQGDYTLAPGSQAINAGDNEYVYDNEDDYDLAGNDRILNDVVDLGAFERDAAPLRVQSYDSSTRKATLQWDAIQGTASYTLKISRDGGTTWTNYARGLADTSTTVNSIYVNQSYAFRIYSVNQQGVMSSTFSEVAFAPCAIGAVNKVGDTISVTLSGAANASAKTRWYYRLDASYVEITQARGLLEYTPVPLTEYAGLQYAHKDYSVAVFAVGVNDSLGSGDEATVAQTKESPSTVVTSLDDVGDFYDGVITLRDAVYYANAGDTITFAPSLKGGTITLGGQEIWIDKSLKLDASALWDETTNAPGITLDANSMSGILGVADYEVEWDEDSGRPIITTFVELDSLAFTRGFSDEGGAIYAYCGGLTISNSSFQNNTAEYGGAIYADYGDLTISNSSFYDNYADGSGGAIYAYCGELAISNSTFQNNTSYDGGALCLYGPKGVITNSTFTQNEAAYGGVILISDASQPNLRLQLSSLTIADNVTTTESDYGHGAIYWQPGSGTMQLDIDNSIVVNNQGGNFCIDNSYWQYYTPEAAEWFEFANSANVYSVLLDLNDGDFNDWSNGSAGVIVYDPSLPLFTNAAQGDYTLATGSQAINCGDNAYVTTQTDLAGNPRIIGGVVDLGAYEYDAVEPVQLDAPTWKSTSSTYNSVTVVWNPVANASGYVVEYKSSTDANYTVMPSTTAATITIPNLAAETTYKLRVYAVGDAVNYSDSTYSTVKAVKTKAAPAVLTPLDAPTWKSSSSTYNSVTVAWNAVDNASGYVVEYKSPTDASYTVMPETTNTTITIPNLASETTYKVRVYAVGDAVNYSNSAYSTVKAVKTKTAPAVLTQLDTPTWKSSSSTANSVTVAWTAVDNASGYVVEYKGENDSTFTPTQATTATTITIPNLAAETTYKLRVYAVGDAVNYSNSAYSTVKAVKTKAAPAVLTPLDTPTWKSSSSTYNSVTVAWNAVDNASGYVVEYKSSTDASYTVMPATTDTTITIPNLAPETTYKLRVYAVGDAVSYSDSVYSSVKAVKTKVAPAVLTQLDAPTWK